MGGSRGNNPTVLAAWRIDDRKNAIFGYVKGNKPGFAIVAPVVGLFGDKAAPNQGRRCEIDAMRANVLGFLLGFHWK
jgi:hypothetical protein